MINNVINERRNRLPKYFATFFFLSFRSGACKNRQKALFRLAEEFINKRNARRNPVPLSAGLLPDYSRIGSFLVAHRLRPRVKGGLILLGGDEGLVQLLILEFAIDGLRIASVNTPDSLSSSLGIIGALILSEFAIKTGWFVSETILYISVVALAAFAQPSMELTYAMKFVRMILLLLTQFFGLYGLVAGWVGAILLIASTKTLGGHGYLYPLIPFNKKDFKKVFLRQRLKKDSQNVQ